MTVSERQKQVVADAAFWRGAIVQSYAHVEYMLAELTVRARRLPEYQRPDDKFPYAYEKRVNAVKAILALPGPLDPHRDAILAGIDAMGAYDVYRHFMAHGLIIARVPYQNEDHLLDIKLYRIAAKGEPEIGDMPCTLEQLRTLAEEMARASNAIVGPIAAAIVDLGLEGV